MSTREEVSARLSEALGEIARIQSFQKPTAAQLDRAEELLREVDGLEKQLRRVSLDEIMAAATGAGGTNLRTVPGAFGDIDRDPIADPRDSAVKFRGKDPWNTAEVQKFGRSRDSVATEYRSRAVSAIEKMPAATDRIRSAATDMVEQHDDETGRLAQLALALSEPTYLRAFARKARDPFGAELDDDERRAVSRVQQFARAMSLTDSAGGYLVPFQLDPSVIITANGSVNQIRQAARQVVATGDVWNGVSAGAVSWSYDAEASEVSDDAPAFAQPSVPIFKAAGFVPISYEALQDAANVTAEVGRLLAFGKDTLEASAFAIGSGVGHRDRHRFGRRAQLDRRHRHRGRVGALRRLHAARFAARPIPGRLVVVGEQPRLLADPAVRAGSVG
jgi:hypothetical protein